MNFDLFFDVFTAIGILYAITAGLVFGSTVLLYLVLKHPPRIIATTWQHAIGAGGVFVVAGTVYFIGQIVQVLAQGDLLLPRIIGRLALWEFFAVSVGIGLGISRSFASKRLITRRGIISDDKDYRIMLDKDHE